MRVSVLTVGVLIQATGSGESQTSRSITAPEVCQECGIRLHRLVTLSDTQRGAGEIYDRLLRRVDTDPQGRYYVSFGEANEPPAVFDRRGRYLRRLGRVGSGPGEFRDAYIIQITNDSVVVAERNPARTSLPLGDPRGQSSTVSIPEFSSAPLDAIRLSTGHLVSNIAILRSREIGYPLHLFLPTGQKRKSFGTGAAEYLPDRGHLLYRRLAPAGAGRFWAAHYVTHVFEEYDSTGGLLRSLKVDADWFSPTEGPLKLPRPDGPAPTVFIAAISFDPAGLLWVAVWVADAEWRRGFGQRIPHPRAPGGFYYKIENLNGLYNTVVEVIDTRASKVLAAQRFDQHSRRLGRGESWPMSG